MPDVRSTIEITKLARELHADEAELSFLRDSSPEELRALRAITAAALHARSESRVKAWAGLSRALPAPVTAKIAESALGPGLSGRIAGAMEPADALRLAEHFSPGFLARLSVAVDPSRIGPIVAGMPVDLVIDVGRRLLADHEVVALARFLGVVDPDVALRLVDGADGADLLQIALYADDREALDSIVQRLPVERLRALLEATGGPDTEALAAVALDLSPATRARLAEVVGYLEEPRRGELLAVLPPA